MTTVLPADMIERFYPDLKTKGNNIVYVHKTLSVARNTTILSETEPQVLRFHYAEDKYNKSHISSYNISIPRLLWVIQLAHCHSTYVRPELNICVIKEPFSVNGVKTPIFIAPFPNQADGGYRGVCIGNVKDTTVDCTLELDEQVGKFTKHMLTSHWNSDLGWGAGLGHPPIQSFADWQNATEKDPEMHKTIKYAPKPEFTVAGLLKRLDQVHMIDGNYGFPLRDLAAGI